MKLMLAAIAAALLSSAAASAQTTPASNAPPDVVLLQKGWSAESRNPALDDDPFLPNVEFHDAQRQQKISDMINNRRARGSETREPPPPRTMKKGDEDDKNSLPSQRGLRTTYTYRAKLKNTGARTIRRVNWGYAFLDPDTHEPLGLHRYSSKVRIRPGESVELSGRSGSPQTSTVSASNVSKKLEEMIYIFRIEYEDGEAWELPLK